MHSFRYVYLYKYKRFGRIYNLINFYRCYNSAMEITKLQEDLLEARKRRENAKIQVLQAVLTRITNAEAVPAEAVTNGVGVGSTEAIRRELSPAQIDELIKEELQDLQTAYESVRHVPDHPYTLELQDKLRALTPYVK